MTAPHGTPESHDEHDAAPDAAGHHADAHVPAHDEHHGGASLGPIDGRMWLAGVAGVVLALAVVAAAVLATDFRFLGAG